MKISLAGLILSDSRMRSKLSEILAEDDGSPVAPEVALDALIEGYVTARLGGTHNLVSESVFPAREFTIDTPNFTARNFTANSKDSHE